MRSTPVAGAVAVVVGFPIAWRHDRAQRRQARARAHAQFGQWEQGSARTEHGLAASFEVVAEFETGSRTPLNACMPTRYLRSAEGSTTSTSRPASASPWSRR